MTCIVGFVKNSVAYIGCDSAVSYGADHMVIQGGEKLFIKEQFLIGAAGAIRVQQAIQYEFLAPPWNGNTDLKEFMITTFLPALRESMKAAGVLDAKGEMEGHALIAIAGRLFDLGSDLTVTTADDGLMSIGTGSRIAFGALWATEFTEMDPDYRMRLVLRAAARYDKSCAGPFFMGQSSRSGVVDSSHIIAL